MDWINQMGPELIQSYSLLGLGLVFLAGIVTSIGPCNLSLIPIIIAHVGGSESGRKRAFALSIAFTLGTATTFVILGFVIGLIGGIFGLQQSLIYYFVAAVCVLMGLQLLGAVSLNINIRPAWADRAGSSGGLGGSYVLGLAMGLVGSQCGTPILLAILSLALASGKWLYGAVLLFIYALGRGVPLVAVGTFTGLVTRMELFARWSMVLDKVSGVILIVVGAYFMWLA
ncbi:MAG: cytochrome c biogenesis CcdA family protein [Syntrophomonadaceae bacterium]|nr:cytochrome c biogenesis CcdA family protein [Syntrophomonadaceae bacterium]